VKKLGNLAAPAAFIAFAATLAPWAWNFPLNDDWAYAQAAKTLAETGRIWLGLVKRGEWANSGNGVMQTSYSGQALGRIELAEPVGGIARVDGGLLMATSFGAALFDGHGVRRYFVDQTIGGRLCVVEANPGEYATAQ